MQSRRNFLKSSLALPAMMGSGSMLGALTGLNAHAADTSGYKAMVCVFLTGGMDCHDTLIPYDTASYDEYASIRASLLDAYATGAGGSSRSISALLPVSPATTRFGARQFALPPQLGKLHQLFAQGNAAIIGNVGPLLEPTDSDSYASNSAKLPPRLFSHNDQRSTWMSFAPEGAQLGWGGRFSDAVAAANGNEMFSQISLYGNSLFLASRRAPAYQVSAGTIPSLYVPDVHSDEEKAILRNHLISAGSSRDNLFERDLVDLSHASLDANDEIRNALAASAPLGTSFPTTELGEQLQTVAQVISARGTIGVNRQIFFVGLNGFDTHSSQSTRLPALQQELGDAIAAFYTATEELGIPEQVTTFTAADFGRTLTVNGNGTDHGWGGHQFVVGGGVRGGDIYGDIPPATLGHTQDAGNGRLIPTTSVEQFAAPLGRWFGLNDSELNAALPGMSRFPAGPLDFI